MPTYFAPEEDSYIRGIIYTLTLLVWISFLLGLIFVIFVIGRFICKRCDAEVTERDEAYNPDKRVRFICGTLWIVLLTLAAIAGTVNGVWGWRKMTTDATAEMVQQSGSIQEDVNSIYKNAERYNELRYPDDYKKTFG